jgi:hypothetical protein
LDNPDGLSVSRPNVALWCAATFGSARLPIVITTILTEITGSPMICFAGRNGSFGAPGAFQR